MKFKVSCNLPYDKQSELDAVKNEITAKSSVKTKAKNIGDTDISEADVDGKSGVKEVSCTVSFDKENDARALYDYLVNDAPKALKTSHGHIEVHQCRHDEARPCDGQELVSWDDAGNVVEIKPKKPVIT